MCRDWLALTLETDSLRLQNPPSEFNVRLITTRPYMWSNPVRQQILQPRKPHDSHNTDLVARFGNATPGRSQSRIKFVRSSGLNSKGSSWVPWLDRVHDFEDFHVWTSTKSCFWMFCGVKKGKRETTRGSVQRPWSCPRMAQLIMTVQWKPTSSVGSRASETRLLNDSCTLAAVSPSCCSSSWAQKQSVSVDSSEGRKWCRGSPIASGTATPPGPISTASSKLPVLLISSARISSDVVSHLMFSCPSSSLSRDSQVLCLWLWRRQIGVPEHQEESQRSQMSCHRKEDPRGTCVDHYASINVLFFSFFFLLPGLSWFGVY